MRLLPAAARTPRDLTGAALLIVAVSIFTAAGGAGPLAFLGVGLAFLASLITWRSVDRAERERRAGMWRYQAEIDRVYAGPVLTPDVEDLRLPRRLPPGQAVHCGTLTVIPSDGSSPVRVHLRWTGDQLILTDREGAELGRIGAA